MAGKSLHTHAVKRSPVAALLLLCLLWSLGSLRIDLLPALDNQALPPTEKQALPFAWLAISASLFALAKRKKWPQGSRIIASILIGVGLFVVPSFLVSISSSGISELTRVALFSLVPVFTAVLEPHISDPYISGTKSQQPRGALIAALLAVGGTLCIFPADIPAQSQPQPHLVRSCWQQPASPPPIASR